MSKSIHIRLEEKLYKNIKSLSDYYGITMSAYIKSKLIPSIRDEFSEKEFSAAEEERLARSIRAGKKEFREGKAKLVTSFRDLERYLDSE